MPLQKWVNLIHSTATVFIYRIIQVLAVTLFVILFAVAFPKYSKLAVAYIELALGKKNHDKRSMASPGTQDPYLNSTKN